MAEIITTVTAGFTAITGVISDTLAWAVGEPLIQFGLVASIVGLGLGLFGGAKSAARA